MESDLITHRGILVAVFNGNEDLTWLREIQESYCLANNDSKLLYVPIDGCDRVDEFSLDISKFIMKNPNASLINHFLWDGYYTKDDQKKRLWEIIDRYIDTGKQILLEEYDFSEEEPFYDYSGGRDEN